MEYLIRIYEGGKICDISLEGLNEYSIGSSEKDSYCIDYAGLEKGHLQFYKRNKVWFVSCKDSSIIPEDVNLSNGAIYTLSTRHQVAVSVYEKTVDDYKEYDLDSKKEHVLGRGDKVDFKLKGNFISRSHAIIYNGEDGFYISDDKSANGTFVNNSRIDKNVLLNDGDIIAIGPYTLLFNNKKLVLGHNAHIVSEEGVKEYPYLIKKTPRIIPAMPTETVTFQDPPQEQSLREGGLLRTIASPIIMIVSMVIMAAVSGMAPVMLIVTVPMSLFTIINGIVQRKKDKESVENYSKKRLERFTNYLEEKEQKIESLKKEQSDVIRAMSPSAGECIKMVENKDHNLWNRTAKESDFMSLMVGYGEVDSVFDVKISEKGFSMDDDELREKAQNMAKEGKIIKDLPITVDLKIDSHVGIIGNRSLAKQVACNMIIQAAATHGYDEVKIILLYSEKSGEDWSWMRWLPHVHDDDMKMRFIASTYSTAEAMLAPLEDVLKGRKSDKDRDNNGKVAAKVPFFLFVFTEYEMMDGISILQYFDNHKNMGLASLYLFDRIENLPAVCNTIIDCGKEGSYLYKKDNAGDKKLIEIEPCDSKKYERFARNLAPFRLPAQGGIVGLPTTVTMLEGYNVSTPDELNILNVWGKFRTNESMAVPIGVKANGESFFFDIHEKHHGPHGMVAGMTGSGKSEMVQSWILGMALKFSPQDVSFVLIDFKGTGLLLPFMNLPHLAGTISDLDKKIGRNLIALQNELTRRKELLDKFGAKSINEYLKFYYAGKTPEKLNFLFIVIDEFAEFKAQFPEFMPVIDSIFAIGRTLGVFIILLTQKPAGVVDEKMNANTKFRWCLKVASSADSKDMLKTPDAAKITVPGRAYVQVGEDEIYELIQSYYSGAAFDPDKEERATVSLKVNLVKENGRRVSYDEGPVIKKEESLLSEINVLVSYIHDTADSADIPNARQIWMPKLPDIIYQDELGISGYKDGIWPEHNGEELNPIIGLVDNPEFQRRDPLTLSFTENGHISVYGAPSTGKTTLLQSAVMAMVTQYTPEDVNIYIMDFGGWNMGIFRDFPHVGGIANDNEDVKIDKLVNMFNNCLNERKEKFSDIGVGSMKAYMEATGEKLPYMVLIVDNFAPMMQLYPKLDEFFVRITGSGGNYGIYILATSTTQLGITFRISQNFKNSLALNMNERSDYQAIVGKTGGIEPEGNEGRGLCKYPKPLEFQVALPARGATESERVAVIKMLAKDMQSRYKGKKANPIPVLPSLIEFDSLSSDKEHDVVIGLECAEVSPIFLPAKRNHYFPIVGVPKSGKTNMLLAILKQKLREGGNTNYYVDIRLSGESIKDKVDKYITSAAAFDELMEELIPILQDRSEKYDEDKTATFDPINVFVDDYYVLFDDIEEKTATRVGSLVKLGEGLNVNLYITTSEDRFADYYMGDGAGLAMSRENTAILLGGNIGMFTGFRSTNLPSQAKSVNVGKYEGYLLENGEATRFMAISCN